jgi:hypothetical protein
MALCGCTAASHAPPAGPAAAPVETRLGGTPSADGSIGTPHPIRVDEIADDGSWMIVCQARRDTDGDGKIAASYGMHGNVHGDELAPYLVFGSGAGSPIDALVARSGDGGWLVVQRGGALELIQAHTWQIVRLSDTDLRDDQLVHPSQRAAVMTDNGRWLAYLRHHTSGDRVAIRELATGREREVAVDGTPWRLWTDLTGRWLRVAVLPPGTDWPVPSRWLPPPSPRGCGPRERALTATKFHGTATTEAWIDLERAAVVPADHVPEDDKADLDAPRGHGGPAPMGDRIYCEHGRCDDAESGHEFARPPGTVEYAYGGLVVMRNGARRTIFDVTNSRSQPFDVPGDLVHGDGMIVTIGDGLYDLTTHKRIAASKTWVVAGHAGARVLLGHPAPPCAPQPDGLPYACVDGIPDLAAGGSQDLPIGPLRWAPP